MRGIRKLLDLLNDRTDAFVAQAEAGAAAVSLSLRDGRLNLPGFVGLLALGQRREARPAAPARAVSRELVETVLSEVAGRRGVPIDPEQARRVLELLAEGGVLGDVTSGLGAALRLAARTPVALARDALSLHDLPGDLVRAVGSDLRDDPPRSVRDVLADLRDGRLDQRRRILSSTLRVLLAEATLGSIVETLRGLLAPDNETFRLAVIVFARAQGVDVDEADVDAVRAALDPADPDLGRLLDRGFERLREQHARIEDAVAVLRRIGAVG